MNKVDMREWVCSLEVVLDNKLKKWIKESRIENGECVQMEWQFEQTHIILDIFWHDHQETILLNYLGPRAKYHFTWHGLTDQSFNKIMDRVGNLAQVTMHPPIDPQD
jgi:hypothetical protein